MEERLLLGGRCRSWFHLGSGIALIVFIVRRIGIGIAAMATDGIGCLDPAFGGQACILLAVAYGERLLVFGERFVALAVKVFNTAEIDMRPGQDAGLFGRRSSLLEI